MCAEEAIQAKQAGGSADSSTPSLPFGFVVAPLSSPERDHLRGDYSGQGVRERRQRRDRRPSLQPQARSVFLVT